MEREERQENGEDEDAPCPGPLATDSTLPVNSTRHIAIQTEKTRFLRLCILVWLPEGYTQYYEKDLS